MNAKLMQILIGVLVFSQSVAAFGKDPGDLRLQGIWFGDGQGPKSRRVLMVDESRFIVITPLGAFVSTFVANDKPSLPEIDIQRYDGDQQLGVYEFAEGKLRLRLGAPSGLRPTLKDVSFPSGKSHWHTVFRRAPTPDGIELLQKHLSSIAPRDPE